MQRFRFIPVFAVAAAAMFAPAHAAAETKIATIRSIELLRDSPQLKAANEKMKAEFQKKQSELESEGKKFAEDVKTFQRGADTMSSQQRANAEKDLNTRKIDLEFKQRDLAEQVQAREAELRRELQAKFSKAIEEVAKEKGITLVLQDPVYAADGIDITDEVLERLGNEGKKK